MNIKIFKSAVLVATGIVGTGAEETSLRGVQLGDKTSLSASCNDPSYSYPFEWDCSKCCAGTCVWLKESDWRANFYHGACLNSEKPDDLRAGSDVTCLNEKYAVDKDDCEKLCCSKKCKDDWIQIGDWFNMHRCLPVTADAALEE
jgi:hypothetical protein